MKTADIKKRLAPEKFRAQLNLLNDAARRVLSTGFSRQQPADRVLAAYFKENRRCGSRDRSFISESIYSTLRFWGYLRKFLPEERRIELEQGTVRFTAKELSALIMAGCFIDGDYNNAYAIAEACQMPSLPKNLNNPCARANQMASYFGCELKLKDSDILPDWILNKLPADLNIDEFLQLLAIRPPMWIRMQTGELQKVIDEFALVNAVTEVHPVISDALLVRAKTNLYTLETFKAGLFEIQDLASQCVAIAAAPKPGERWYDPCAGAGGKSLHLAQLMKRKGTVVAGDVRAAKLDDLRKRAKRAAFPNIITKPHDGTMWHGKHLFDGVLADAPCSCSGVWRRNPGAQWKLSPENITELSCLQKQILENYSPAVRPGGVLVYATCSIFEEENASVVRAFLSKHNEFRLDPFEHPLTGKIVPGMVRIDSRDGDCDALFIARMRKVK